MEEHPPARGHHRRADGAQRRGRAGSDGHASRAPPSWWWNGWKRGAGSRFQTRLQTCIQRLASGATRLPALPDANGAPACASGWRYGRIISPHRRHHAQPRQIEHDQPGRAAALRQQVGGDQRRSAAANGAADLHGQRDAGVAHLGREHAGEQAGLLRVHGGIDHAEGHQHGDVGVVRRLLVQQREEARGEQRNAQRAGDEDRLLAAAVAQPAEQRNGDQRGGRAQITPFRIVSRGRPSVPTA